MKLKTKFGKNINLYLSNEVISKLNKLTNNKSAYIEALINKEFHKENEKE